jgi:hypothetical protein
MAIPRENGSKPTGFAGLDSLVSNVESDLTPSTSAPSSEANSDTDGKSRIESEKIDSQPVVTASTANESPKSEGGASHGSGARWAVGIAVGVGVLILLANLDRKSSSPPYSPPEAPVASVPSQDASPIASSELPGEEMPPVGENLVLNGPQIRWCVYEKARIEMMKDIAAEEEITAFNTYVSRYNERCAQFQYRQGMLAVIEGELGQQGRRLQSEGAERILSLRSSSGVSEEQESSSAHLQPPRQDAASELGKDEAAPSAKPGAVAPPIAATDNESAIDIEVVRSDFGLFSPPNSGKPTFQVSRRVPLQEGQGYGWYIELKTTKPRIKWREEMVLPSPPATWGIQSSTAQHSISDDRRTLATEREVVPNRGLIYNVWGVAAGDPKGPHVVRVYVEGKLVRTFEFETE